MTMPFGRVLIKRSLIDGVSSAPPLAIATSDETSAVAFSIAARSGRAIASPTTVDHRHALALDRADDLVGVQPVDHGREDQ